MIGCRSHFFSCRIDRVLRFTNTYVASTPTTPYYFHFQGQNSYHCLSCNFVMGGGRKKKLSIEDHSNKQKKIMNSIWRPVVTSATSYEESSIKDATIESEDANEVRELSCSTSSTISNVMKVAAEAVDEITESATGSSVFQDSVKNEILEGDSSLSTGKHSISVAAKLQIFNSFFIF